VIIPTLRNFLLSSLFQFRAALVFTILAIVLAGSDASAEKLGIALLQGMDKVTARVTMITAPVGEVIKFGTLEIIARTCDKRPPEEPPESAAFLDIWEVREGAPATSLYRGWMFASSPALSAMEHPVYDVWVLDCVIAQGIEPEAKPN
jgi:hypothetical protein